MAAELWVPGEPVAKGRPRVSTIGGRARMFTPRTTMEAEANIASLWTAPMVPQGVAVVLGVRAYRQRPKTHYKRSGSLSALGARSVHPIKRPDLDNIVKLVMDGLNGVAFHDDSQVIEIHAFSEWAHVNGPGVLIKVMAVHE